MNIKSLIGLLTILTCTQAVAHADTVEDCDRTFSKELVTSNLKELKSHDIGAEHPAEWALYNELVMREPAVAPADYRIYYGPNYQHFGDLRLPEGEGPFPLVMVIHGGGWASAVDLHYTAALAAALTCEGFATWNIEYRRVGSGGEWPGMFEDVAAGADYVQRLSNKFPLDIDQGIFVAGHSSGGHLAYWLAARPEIAGLNTFGNDLPPIRVRGAISLDGLTDIAGLLEGKANYVPTFEKLLSEKSGSEAFNRKLASISPINHLPLNTPQLLIEGESSTFFNCCGNDQYVERATHGGDDINTVVIDGYHFEPVDPANDQLWEPLIETLKAWAGSNQ